MTREETERWTTIIRPKSGLLDFSLKDLLHYRFLMFLFVRRDFVSQYKQTLFGPLWIIIQPLFTTFIYTFVFGNLAKIPTDGVAQPVFYMAGTTLWNFSLLAWSLHLRFSLATRVSLARSISPASLCP